MTTIGYARVSTAAQNHDLQLDALTKAGCDRIFADAASGAKADREQLLKCLDYLREGDTLVVWALDRLGRDLLHLITTVNDLTARGITFRSIKENIDSSTPSGRMMIGLFGTLAEFERERIRERSEAGRAAAKARGRNGGRKSTVDTGKLAAAKSMNAQGHSVAEICRALGISRAAYYRAMEKATA